METGSDALSLSYDGTQLGLNTLTNGILNILPIMANKAAITFDYIAVTYPSTTSEVYVLKAGGVGGTTAATFTVVYTTVSKYRVSSIAQT